MAVKCGLILGVLGIFSCCIAFLSNSGTTLIRFGLRCIQVACVCFIISLCSSKKNK